ncbi:unnamed protein product [Didymodactylos carnosus]|uniref:Uncharacterized protein n=1 Tax=Didymodactylos carnosus TaxID=1234261 RepID=A0A816F142_9BILA|nr:unnamed protein product [Didymodactylos carnosus]CAF4596698.1 unnamed protein product [Didymodactylos carnosus]
MLNLSAALMSHHWRAIAQDIARDGDPQDYEEFEAAKQAFLHIKEESEARIAALAIEKKWKSHFGQEATVGSIAQKGTLMSMIRYPLMNKAQAKEATLHLPQDQTVSQFLDEQKFKVIQ